MSFINVVLISLFSILAVPLLCINR